MTPPRSAPQRRQARRAPAVSPLALFHAPVQPGDLAYDAAQAAVAALRVEAQPFTHQPASPTFRARLLTVAHAPTYVEAVRESPVPPVPRPVSDRDLQLCGAVHAGVEHALATGGLAVVAGPGRFGAGPGQPIDGLLGVEAFNAPAFAVGLARHMIGTLGKHPAPQLVLIEGAGPMLVSRAAECLARKLIKVDHWSLAELAGGVDFEEPLDDDAPPLPRAPRLAMGVLLRGLTGALHRLATPGLVAPHLVVYEATSEGLGGDDVLELPASDFQVLLRDRLVIDTCRRMGWPLVILAGSGSWTRQRALYEAARTAAADWPTREAQAV